MIYLYSILSSWKIKWLIYMHLWKMYLWVYLICICGFGLFGLFAFVGLWFFRISDFHEICICRSNAFVGLLFWSFLVDPQMLMGKYMWNLGRPTNAFFWKRCLIFLYSSWDNMLYIKWKNWNPSAIILTLFLKKGGFDENVGEQKKISIFLHLWV